MKFSRALITALCWVPHVHSHSSKYFFKQRPKNNVVYVAVRQIKERPFQPFNLLYLNFTLSRVLKPFFICWNSLLMRAFTSPGLLMQSYAIMFCLKVLRLKILVHFAWFTCFVDVLYFKKLHRDTISNFFRLNKRFIAENVRLLLTFLRKQRCNYAFQHSCISLREE